MTINKFFTFLTYVFPRFNYANVSFKKEKRKTRMSKLIDNCSECFSNAIVTCIQFHYCLSNLLHERSEDTFIYTLDNVDLNGTRMYLQIQ